MYVYRYLVPGTYTVSVPNKTHSRDPSLSAVYADKTVFIQIKMILQYTYIMQYKYTKIQIQY